jgi:hypothetical protein
VLQAKPIDWARVAVCALFYGNYPQLHRRLLLGLEQYVPAPASFFFWLNEVCPETRADMDAFAARRERVTLVPSAENTPKYAAMRSLFSRTPVSEFDWLVWFDDDTVIHAADWAVRTERYVTEHLRENICYIGQCWLVPYLLQHNAIKSAAWYRGRLDPVPRPKHLRFATGSYWWLRNDVRAALNWPDVRLVHNGGDTLLAAAVYQAGLPFHDYSYGVKPNDAKRRGRSDPPLR